MCISKDILKQNGCLKNHVVFFGFVRYSIFKFLSYVRKLLTNFHSKTFQENHELTWL